MRLCSMNDIKNLYKDYIKQAKNGDLNAAYDILEGFKITVELGGVPHEDIMEYIAECFSDILKEVKPEHALNLYVTNPGNRPPRRNGGLIDLGIAEQVVIKTRKYLKETGKKQVTLAKEEVAAETNKSFKTVEAAYTKHRKDAEYFAEAKEKWFAERIANRAKIT